MIAGFLNHQQHQRLNSSYFCPVSWDLAPNKCDAWLTWTSSVVSFGGRLASTPTTVFVASSVSWGPWNWERKFIGMRLPSRERNSHIPPKKMALLSRWISEFPVWWDVLIFLEGRFLRSWEDDVSEFQSFGMIFFLKELWDIRWHTPSYPN